MSIICKKCTFYVPYYTKSATGFTRCGYGICQKENKSVKQNNCICELFKDKAPREKRRYKVLLYSLQNALTAIFQISLILQETQDDVDAVTMCNIDYDD